MPPREHAPEILIELSAVAVTWRPAVVLIRSGFRGRTSTGFLVRANLIATTARAGQRSRRLHVAFEDATEATVKGVRIHPRWSRDAGSYWDVALVGIDPEQGRPVVISATSYDVLDPVIVLGYSDEDVPRAQVGTIDGIIMDRGAEVIFVSGFVGGVPGGAPVFSRQGTVIGMVFGDLVDPRHAGDWGSGSGVAAVVPIGVVTSLVNSR